MKPLKANCMVRNLPKILAPSKTYKTRATPLRMIRSAAFSLRCVEVADRGGCRGCRSLARAKRTITRSNHAEQWANSPGPGPRDGSAARRRVAAMSRMRTCDRRPARTVLGAVTRWTVISTACFGVLALWAILFDRFGQVR